MNQSLIYSWYEQYKNGIFRYALSITKDPYQHDHVTVPTSTLRNKGAEPPAFSGVLRPVCGFRIEGGAGIPLGRFAPL